MPKNKTLTDLTLILLFGLLTGVLTSFGQTFIPAPFTQLANSYSVWLLMSFIAALFMHRYRYAIVGGAVIQYLAIAFYHVASAIRFDTGFSFSSNLVWILGGTLVGPLVGFLGLYLKNKQKHSYLAPAFMAGLAYSEAIYQFAILKYNPEGFVFIGLGTLILTWLLYKYRTNIPKTIVATAVFTGLMFVAYGVILAAIF